jgi:hypothetical protein
VSAHSIDWVIGQIRPSSLCYESNLRYDGNIVSKISCSSITAWASQILFAAAQAQSSPSRVLRPAIPRNRQSASSSWRLMQLPPWGRSFALTAALSLKVKCHSFAEFPRTSFPPAHSKHGPLSHNALRVTRRFGNPGHHLGAFQEPLPTATFSPGRVDNQETCGAGESS